MLWQGEEFCENYVLAAGGNLRVHFRRDMHWEYFYEDQGSPLVRLHRRLGTLRRAEPALRGREVSYFEAESRPNAGLLAYGRGSGASAILVFLNFSDTADDLSVPALGPGPYHEGLDAPDRVQQGLPPVTAEVVDGTVTVTIPSNYGAVYLPN
jgi:1,4-alpha-glucan branching enzyme